MAFLWEVALEMTLERKVGMKDIQGGGVERGETASARPFGGHSKFFPSKT